MESQPDNYAVLFELLRHRAETPAWMIALFVAFVILVVGLIYGGVSLQQRREAKYLRRSFAGLAREKGLDEEESRIVWQLAVAGRTEHPLALLSSASEFDRFVNMAPPGIIPKNRLPILREKLGFTYLPLGRALTHTLEIRVGQHLWVGFKRGESTRFCRCVLVENNTESLLVTPIVKADEEAFKDLVDKDVLFARFWRRGDTEYQFRTSLLPETDPDRVTLSLAHTDQLNRLQRRDFFRLPVRLPVAIFGLNNAEEAGLPPETLRAQNVAPAAQGILNDLSAGGAALIVDHTLAFGSHIWLAPTGKSTFSLLGVACRVIEVSPEKPEGHHHRLEFVNLDEVHQDELARQIHQAQIR